MGALCGTEASSDAERKANRDINVNMGAREKENKKEHKLLLLGTGSSGKSTLFKGLRLVNGSEFELKEQIDTRHVIRFNIVVAVMTLLQKSQMLYESDPKTFADCKIDITNSQVIQAVQVVVSFAEETFIEENKLSPTLLEALGNAVFCLWSLKALTLTYENKRSRLTVLDNMDHFLNKVKEVMKPDYLPDNEDVLKARVRTTGMIEMMYEMNDNIFKICDVGGQRSERRKWISSFEHVSAIIFVGALNHYSCVLFEDENINAMHEALELFDYICNSKWFRKSEMIVFLNKDDVFKDALGCGNSLSLCFSKEKNWNGDEWNPQLNYVVKPNVHYLEDPEFPPCYDAALVFILEEFLKINKNPDKTIFHHVTCATDSNSIKTVFWDVQNILIRTGLRTGGLMV